MVCLVALAVGVSVERGATLLGLAIVAGTLSLVALVAASIRRLRARRSPPAAR